MLKLFPVVLLFVGVCGKPADSILESNRSRRDLYQDTAGLESPISLSNDLVRDLSKYIARSDEDSLSKHHSPRRRDTGTHYAAVPRSRRQYEDGFQRSSHRRERALFEQPSHFKDRRGLNVGIDIATMAPGVQQGTEDINRLLNEDLQPLLMEALNHTPSIVEQAVKQFASDLVANEISTPGGTTLCDECKEVENLILEEKQQEMNNKPNTRSLLVRPMYPCDDWDTKSRTCFLDRNLGDAVTFVLYIENLSGERPHIDWRQEFHLRNSNARKDSILDPANPPWNVVIGTQGYEFRLSPITESDIDFNRFSATVATELVHGFDVPPITTLNKVIFQIRTVAIDLGFVYPGEALTLNVHSFASLPLESMKFKWFLERDGEASTLPSNMRTSPTGGSVAISELRKEQEGILTCSVYTNKDIFATKKRFLIKELVTDVLMGMEPQKHSDIEEVETVHPKVLSRHVRQVENEDEIDFVNLDKSIDERNALFPYYGAASKMMRPRLTRDQHNGVANIPQNYELNPQLSMYNDLNGELNSNAASGGVVELENNNGYPQIIPLSEKQVPLNGNPFEFDQNGNQMLGNYPENSELLSNVKRIQVSEGTELDRNEGKNGVVVEIEKKLEANPAAVPQNVENLNPYDQRNEYQEAYGNGAANQFLTNHVQMQPSYVQANVNDQLMSSHQRPVSQAEMMQNGQLERNFNYKENEPYQGHFPFGNSPHYGQAPHEQFAPNIDQNPPSREEQKYIEAALSEEPNAPKWSGHAFSQQETVPVSNDHAQAESAMHHHENLHPVGHNAVQVPPVTRPEVGFVVDIEKTVQNREVKAEDKISRLLSDCHKDAQCAGHAVCVHNIPKNAGFCRCHSGYHGNGIFCWEDTNLRNAYVDEEESNVEAHTESHMKPVVIKPYLSASHQNNLRRKRMKKPREL